jgi:hypothetical protein
MVSWWRSFGQPQGLTKRTAIAGAHFLFHDEVEKVEKVELFTIGP